MEFAKRFEAQFITQADNENREIEDNLQLGWRLLGVLPRVELKRIRPEFVEKYYVEATDLP